MGIELEKEVSDETKLSHYRWANYMYALSKCGESVTVAVAAPQNDFDKGAFVQRKNTVLDSVEKLLAHQSKESGLSERIIAYKYELFTKWLSKKNEERALVVTDADKARRWFFDAYAEWVGACERLPSLTLTDGGHTFDCETGDEIDPFDGHVLVPDARQSLKERYKNYLDYPRKTPHLLNQKGFRGYRPS